VTVKVAGGKQLHIDAQLQEPADATGGVDSNMASCRYLITFSIPTTRLQEGVKCSAPPAASCQGAGGVLGAMESSDFEFEKSWHHDPAWQSLTISVHVQGPTAEVALSSLIFVSLSGWWGAGRECACEHGHGEGGGGKSAEGRSAKVKRVLYLLHVQSVWRLLEMQVSSQITHTQTIARSLFFPPLPCPSVYTRSTDAPWDAQNIFVTGDSDVMTLVCPTHMEQDEWHAYAQHEVEALHSADFHPVSFLSVTEPVCQDPSCSLRHQVFFICAHAYPCHYLRGFLRVSNN